MARALKNDMQCPLARKVALTMHRIKNHQNSALLGELRQPLSMPPNRVTRTYRGGALLESFRGAASPSDGWQPEDWLASTTASRLDAQGREGLSQVELGRKPVLLRDLVQQFPGELLGEKHIQLFGADPYLLVKLLDSCERLRIQVHPTAEQAQSLFGTAHGKAEAWCIVETRRIGGEDPFILLGFKEGIRRCDFECAVLSEGRQALVDLLHRIVVKPGDLFMVEPGVPHAIGPGVFMLEIQEPSDLTVYVEPAEPGTIHSPANNLGLGWSRALELFSYHGQSWEVNIAKCRLTPLPGPRVPGGTVEEVPMGGPAQPRFGVSKLLIKTQLTLDFDTYRIVVVTGGQGAVEWSGQQKRIKRGDVLFLPAIMANCLFRADPQGSGDMEVLVCNPPSAYL
jgi:mannose-6-phosphate isomerase